MYSKSLVQLVICAKFRQLMLCEAFVMQFSNILLAPLSDLFKPKKNLTQLKKTLKNF